MMNCYIIMSPRTGFKATIWWSLTTQMNIFLQSQTQCEQKRWKLQPFYLDLTLKQFYTCSQKIVLILFEPIFKSVLNILCIMLNSHLNRYKTIEKKVETCCSGKGPKENGHYFAMARYCLSQFDFNQLSNSGQSHWMLQLLNAFLVSWLLWQALHKTKCMKWTKDCHWLDQRFDQNH